MQVSDGCAVLLCPPAAGGGGGESRRHVACHLQAEWLTILLALALQTRSKQLCCR